MDLLQFLCNEGREILRKTLPASSCVSSSRYAIEILRKYKVAAFPQPVHFVTTDSDGMIVLGRSPSAEVAQEHWNGHLVVVTRTHLLDLSLDQIDWEPSAFPIQEFPFGVEFGGKVGVYFKDYEANDYWLTDAWKNLWKEPFEATKDDIIL